MTTFADLGEALAVLDNGTEMVRIPKPERAGLYVWRDLDSLSISDISEANAREYVFRVEADRQISHVQVPASFRPMSGLTFSEVQSFIDGLNVAQLRRVVAWLIWINRDNLPDDVRNKI